MTLRTSPASELLTFRNWYTEVERALDGSGFPSGTYSEFQPSGIRTRGANGRVEVANFDLTVTVVRRRSWVIMSQATSALLEHERLHFLIAVCVGRDLHEDAFTASASSSGALSSALSALLADAQRRTQRISDRYDLDTRNGANAMQQAVWAMRIRRWFSIGFKDW